MNMKDKRVIRLTLITEDDCIGRRWLDGSNGKIEWDREPEMPTEQARFAAFDGYNGPLLETHKITGDRWREIESLGSLDEVPMWFRRGATLVAAVNAAITAEDPPGFDDAYETVIEGMRADNEFLVGILHEIREFVERHDARLDNPEDGDPQPPTGDDYNTVVEAIRKQLAKLEG